MNEWCEPHGSYDTTTPVTSPGTSNEKERYYGSVTRNHKCVSKYTLGASLRIPYIKNIGVAFALEALRICPWLTPRPRRAAEISIFLAQNVKILEKIARCARQDDLLDHRYRDFATHQGKVKSSPK